MKLLDDICRARGFSSCIALTYNVDLGWFERFVLRQLRRWGVRHFLVFADRARLSEAIGADLDLLHGLGRSYAVLGLKATRSFHPKLLLLTGDKAARLYVGSGNLTSGGYARNAEIFERWDVAEADATVPGAFEAVRRFLDQLCAKHLQSNPPGFVKATLDATFCARVLSKPQTTEPETEIWGSPVSLLARLETPPSPAKRLRLLAPSFDPEGGAVIAIAARLRAKTFQVITDIRTTNLTRRAYDAIRAAGGELRVSADERRLHAKALVAEGPGWALAVSGSANLSHAAWQGTNVELVAVRRDALAADVAALLDDLPTADFTPQLRAQLPEAAEEPEPDPSGPAIIDARWEGPATIRVTLAAGAEHPTGAEIKSVEGECPAVLASLPDASSWLWVSCSGEARERATAVRLLSAQGPGPWAVVHDTSELAEQARPESRVQAALRDLLGDETFNVDGAEKLLEMMASMWQERQRQSAESLDAGEVANEDEDVLSRPDWCWVSESDFSKQEATTPPPGGPGHGSVPLPVNLLHRLLFGDDQESEGDADEGESEAREDQGGLEGERLATPRAATPERESFLKAAEEALLAYLGQLRAEESSRSASRLLDDMHLLAAIVHYAFMAGALTPSRLRGQMIRLLNAFLGLRSAPFPSALESIPPAERAEIWARAPLLLLGAVLAYNTCIADLDVARDERDLKQLLDGLAPALWIRNLVRAAPPEAVDEAIKSLDRDLPRLRRGELWLGSAWPTLVAQIPFEEFARRLLEDARDIVGAERVILPRLGEVRESFGIDDRVLSSGRDAALACGWIEQDRKNTPRWALLYDSAFLMAEPPLNAPNARMHRVLEARGKLVRIETAFVWAEAAGDGGAAQRGIEAMNRML